MVSLSFALGWRRWGGVTLICFYGIARVGEVLKCRRSDLLLPRDLLEDGVSNTYVMLKESKTSRRGPSRIQRLKIDDRFVTKLLDKVYGKDELNMPLYGGPPSLYRSRWDFLLRSLSTPGDLHLTPGGLRGGGAVDGYRRGLGVSEIQWRMRLRSLTTLESYLQEVAAASALTGLPPETLRSIRASAMLFEHLC